MAIESFKRAKNLIINCLIKDKALSYTQRDIENIFTQNRQLWNIADYRNYKHFIKFLSKENILILDKLNHEHEKSLKQVLRKKKSSNFDVGLSIKKNGYLSNYSAMQLHEITLQIPKTIFVSYDKYKVISHTPKSKLLQSSVDKAFGKPQRKTTQSYKSEYNNTTYTFLQKKYLSNEVGIINKGRYKVTDLERTLIDIAVRPAYSGGVFEVLEAFINSKEIINIELLDNYLNALDYSYPYHQLLGFYLNKAGIDQSRLSLLLNKKSNIDFYLTYNITNKKYDENWGIYYPMGF